MKLQVGVKALIKNKQNQYLFLLRTKLMGTESEARWDIPGGRIETDESLLDALKREILEETGMQITNSPVLMGAQDIFTSDELHVVRLTYTLDADGDVSISDEHQDARWLTLEEIKQLNLDLYVRALI
jgi:8-oxo-dGTP diphosphatase